MNEALLQPLINPGAPSKFYGPPDVNITLTPSAIFRDNGPDTWFLNKAAFCPPAVPVLLQIVNGVTPLVPPASIITLQPNQTVQVTIPTTQDGSGDGHPFHLHGHVFDVVRVAGSSRYNYDNPVRRDVVNTGLIKNGDSVTIQFRTDNSGPWYFHCHIDWHLEGGMAVVFAENIPDLRNKAIGADWKALCPTFDASNPDTHLGKGGGCL